MGCFIVLFALLLPRAAMVLIFLFTTWFQQVFATWLLPILGFIFLPYTTLAYTAAVLNTGGSITLGWGILIIIAVIADVGHWGGGYRWRRVRVVRR